MKGEYHRGHMGFILSRLLYTRTEFITTPIKAIRLSMKYSILSL